MDFEKGKEYIRLLKAGTDEDDIVRKYGITHESLYAVVSYLDQRFAREVFRNFCDGCANDLCFGWPGRDETPCLVRGYEPHCPLNKHETD